MWQTIQGRGHEGGFIYLFMILDPQVIALKMSIVLCAVCREVNVDSTEYLT